VTYLTDIAGDWANRWVVTYLTDIAGDWANTAGVVDLTLDPVDGGANTTEVKAILDPLGPNYRDLAGGIAAIAPTDVVWFLWDVTLDDAIPERGDVLQESDGTRWTVLSFSPIRAEGQVIKWRCLCREEE